MQIVIDILDDDYERLKVYEKAPFCSLTSRVYEAVANGLLIPKGHGDLIDRNELNKDLIANEWITDDDGGGLEEILFNAPTIIEADTESEEV